MGLLINQAPSQRAWPLWEGFTVPLLSINSLSRLPQVEFMYYVLWCRFIQADITLMCTNDK